MSGLRIVEVTNVFFAEVLGGCERPFTTDLPADVEVVGIIESDMCKRNQTFQIICRSAEWDQPTEGAAIPVIMPTMTVYAPIQRTA
jgi:hypothetical protein